MIAATGAIFVRYPWNDVNGDTFVQAGELDLTNILSRSAAYDPADPCSFRTAGTVDPQVKNDRTREFIVGIDRQFGSTIAVGGSLIRRKYDRFQWNDRLNWTSANYRPVTLTPAGCPADGRCETITYYEPSSPLPAPFQYTNVPDRWRDFTGVEFTFSKRMSRRWSMNASYAYNDAVDSWNSPASYEDPTCVAGTVGSCPGTQIFAPESGGSGIDNVFVNAKWLVKVSGVVQLPFGVHVAGSINSRQGYPFPAAIRTPNRANSGGTADVHLDPLGDVRQPSLHQVDFRVDRRFRLGAMTVRPTLDIFNLTNANTVLTRRRLQASDVANDISGIIAPRVARFGITVQW